MTATTARQPEPVRSMDDAIAQGRLCLSPTARETRRLIVLVHGWLRTPRDYRGLLQAFRVDPDLHDCDILPWGFRAGRFSNDSPMGIAQALATEIDRLDRGYDYGEIFLIGHSMGGVLVRTALLDGIERGLAWALPSNRKIRRLVLLASTNRGFAAPEFYGPFIFLARNSVFPISTLPISMLRGSPFVSGVRLRWLREFQSVEPPDTVQLLGVRDSVVGPDDSADLFRYGNSAPVPIDADHSSIVPIDAGDPIYPHLVDAMIGPMAGKPRPAPPAARSRVVFLLHGIRDYGPWLDDLRDAVLRLDPDAEVLPLRYGYFRLIDFLLPPLRARKVRDFVDRYVQELAKRPDVPFSVAGHSNGTYILGSAIKDVEGVKFERAYLAGSVLPDDFDWNALLGDKVAQVRNDAAGFDWIVALICGTLSWLPIYRDLGVGGFVGFQKLPPGCETRYLQGGHGAALDRSNLDSIAEFLVRGRPASLTGLPSSPSKWLDRGSRGLFWILLLLLLVVAFLLIWVVPVPANVSIAIALSVMILIVLIAY